MRYLFLRRILLNMRPHAPTLLLHYYICVLLLSKACVILRRILLHDMRPHAPTLLLYCMCVLILGLVWSAPQTVAALLQALLQSAPPHPAIYASSCHYYYTTMCALAH
jgi:hypothetical protein